MSTHIGSPSWRDRVSQAAFSSSKDRETSPKLLQNVSEMTQRPPPGNYRFDSFALDTETGALSCEGVPSLLGQRGAALLRFLLERAASPVSKDALIDAAWPGLAVEESNLTVQIAALRRALELGGGRGWIETLPRRGYRYTGPPVTRVGANADEADHAALLVPERPSIAVLPFEHSSEVAWFADGMVDDIITGLSRIRWLFVIARNSSFVWRGRTADVKQVGRDLGVRHVLQGTVRRADDRVRINAQLADAASGAQIWAEHYDRTVGDLFALQDEIALAVMGAIEPSLRRAEVDRIRRKRPDSLDAYELVLRAQPDVDSGMPDRAALALPQLQRALAFDPAYALAHGLAAMSYHNRFLRAGLKEEDRLASVRHARLAIEHGRDDAMALTFAGFSLGMDAHDRQALSPHSRRRSPRVPRPRVDPRQRCRGMGWRGGTRNRLERARLALEPVRSVGVCRLRRAGARPFLSRSSCGGCAGSPQIQPRQSRPQHYVGAARGFTRCPRAAGGGEGGCGQCAGTTANLPHHGPVRRGRLRA
ncbi:winged helix-turn-helix domain-containing protein [Bradyrhizobium sp. BWA-3-5]|uniref:winged helix-turn-helix domain-containing protein n=1 Tax=Bradyrhizobium sp. BWA-3-5 TaxID=3080013 RepID=UPI00293EA562|nr:winged helix-turn-helix domain-containing protein [Bradyrhizobium sp. BWA-3-5]WOH67967.1 winged helix-turn-helix domain-containing protein [Bradyrhizobium sp. BWA-3-5]